MLERAFELNQLSCVSRLVVTSEAFQAAFKIGLPDAMKRFDGLTPIIHISAHGDEGGLQLSDGSRIKWDELKALLQPINKALNHNLLVCMSCCDGYSGVRMAMTMAEEDFPYYAIIGSTGKPTWAETSIAFCVFYHHVNKGEFVIDAVKVMNAAAGTTEFLVEKAENSRTFFRDYCSKPQLQVAQETLAITSQGSLPELAKFSDTKEGGAHDHAGCAVVVSDPAPSSRSR